MNGGTVPSSSELFMKPTEQIVATVKQEMATQFTGKAICLVLDEASDKVRRKKVLNLCGTNNSLGYLLTTDFLEMAPNAIAIPQAGKQFLAIRTTSTPFCLE